jgi:hypothetical protein
MFASIAGIGVSLLKSYLIKLATKEFAHYCFFEIAQAIVDSTETKEDNKWLEKVKETVES